MSNAKIKYEDLENLISLTFDKVYKTQTGNKNNAKLIDETILLDTGLDSLGFAVLVAQLDEELGFDPFTLSKSLLPYNF